MSTKTKIAKTPESKREKSTSQIGNDRFSKPIHSAVDQILHLQRRIGNQAVQRLFKSGVVQAKLRIGQPGDAYEQEADRVADQVMRMPEPDVNLKPTWPFSKGPSCGEEAIQTKLLVSEITPLVQRQVEEEEPIMTKGISGSAPQARDDLHGRLNQSRGNGQPLPDTDRGFMERRFGVDFSGVRAHTDSNAVQLNRELNAQAFTLGRDIYFGSGKYSPDISSGKRLLAHELTHVVQQGHIPQLSNMPVQKTIVTHSSLPRIQFYRSRICGRRSTQFRDFPKTYISNINIDLTSPSHSVTLTWTGPNASRGSTGPFHSSPGAGRCDLNCNNVATSRTSGSLCTPKGTRRVERYRCVMPGHRRATNVTYFHWGRRVALHYFPSVPNYPASHGCVRLPLIAARFIYDNSRRNATTVTVGGTWTGRICYDRHGRRRNRRRRRRGIR